MECIRGLHESTSECKRSSDTAIFLWRRTTRNGNARRSGIYEYAMAKQSRIFGNTMLCRRAENNQIKRRWWSKLFVSMIAFFIDKSSVCFLRFDWQVFSILSQTEGFFSSVNLFPTTRLSRGFHYTKKQPRCGKMSRRGCSDRWQKRK